MTSDDNAPSFPTVPTVPHKSLILLGRWCCADGSDGIPQVIDFIDPTVSGGECHILRIWGRPRHESGGLPMKTTSERRRRRPIGVNSIGGEAVRNCFGAGDERGNQSDCGIVAINVTLTVTLCNRGTGAEPTNRASDGHCARSASLSRRLVRMVAIRQRTPSGDPVGELWVLPGPNAGRGFRARLFRLRTKTAPGGYQTQTRLRAPGLATVPRLHAARAGGVA
jgi:hypothetical protein